MDEREERARRTEQYLNVVFKVILLVLIAGISVLVLTALALRLWEGTHG